MVGTPICSIFHEFILAEQNGQKFQLYGYIHTCIYYSQKQKSYFASQFDQSDILCADNNKLVPKYTSDPDRSARVFLRTL